MNTFANYPIIKILLVCVAFLFVHNMATATDSLDTSLIDGTLYVPDPEPEEVFTPEEFLEFNDMVSTDDPSLTTQRESEQVNQQHPSKVVMAKVETRKALTDAKTQMLTLQLERLAAKDEVLMQRKADVEAKLAEPNLKDRRRQRLQETLANIEQRQITNAEKEALVTELLVKVEATVQGLEEKLADLTNNAL